MKQFIFALIFLIIADIAARYLYDKYVLKVI